MKNIPFNMLETLFDQDESAAKRDFVHVCLTCLHGLGDKYLQWIHPDSEAFNKSKGKNAFKYFPSVGLAADGTKVCLI